MKTIALSTTLLALTLIGCGESRPTASVPAVATRPDGDNLSSKGGADDPDVQLVKLHLPGMT